MGLMDKWGRIKIFKWRINIIDFLAILFLICLIPISYISYRLIIRPKVTVEKPKPTHYVISRSCPNCAKGKNIEIPFGEPKPLEWKGICEKCGNEVWYIKIPLKPKPKLLPKEMNYEQFYYKQLLKERGWLE